MLEKSQLGRNDHRIQMFLFERVKPMFLLFRVDAYESRPTVDLSNTNMHASSMSVKRRKEEEQQIVDVIIAGRQNIRIKQMVCLSIIFAKL